MLAKFEIDAAPGNTKVVVNGTDLTSNVTHLQLELAPGQLPRLTLRMTADGRIEGEGVVAVQSAQDDVTQIVLDLVAGIDAEEWTRLAMNGIATLGTSPAESFKQALLEMLSESG